MKSRLTHVVLGGMLLLGVHSLRAQEPPPSPDFPMPSGFAGPRMEILGFGEMHPGKIVANAPYNAVSNSGAGSEVPAQCFGDGTGEGCFLKWSDVRVGSPSVPRGAPSE